MTDPDTIAAIRRYYRESDYQLAAQKASEMLK